MQSSVSQQQPFAAPDVHLYHHGEAVLEKGYVVGHEPMGIVEEVGSQVQTKKSFSYRISFQLLIGAFKMPT